MTLTIKQLKDILNTYPDNYHICGLCVQIYHGSTKVKDLHELQIPYFDIDKVPAMDTTNDQGTVIMGSSEKEPSWIYNHFQVEDI